MRRTIIVLGLVFATFLGALAVFAHSIPGHTGHTGTNIATDPGAGRHRVSEHGTSDKLCDAGENVKVNLKITVAPGGTVDLNAVEVESAQIVRNVTAWTGTYDGTIDGDLGFGIFSDGTHTVKSYQTPHRNSHIWHVALEVAGENADLDLDSVFITRSCVAD